MKNLVIAVSPDSSLELLGAYADIIILDKNPMLEIAHGYETVYIRSHFSRPDLMPQVFRTEIDYIVKQVLEANPDTQFIDKADTVEAIVAFEDKWAQYQKFHDFMPNSELLGDATDLTNFKDPIFKRRLSSRGTGIAWKRDQVSEPVSDWIVQEKITILEELRIYVIHDEVYPVGAVRQSLTTEQSAQAVDSRRLTDDEIDFALGVGKAASELDIAGLDVARTADGQLKLMEVNRSPGFGAFYKLTGVNLADLLYGV